MEERMREMLAEGETLLWSGRPVSFRTMDKTNKRGLTISLIVKAVVTLSLLAGYFRLTSEAGVPVKPGLLAIILFFAGFAFYYPLHTAKRLREQTYYGLTESRLLRIGTKEDSVAYDRIKTASLRTDEDGQATLLCGDHAQKLRPGQWRGAADGPFDDDPRDAEAHSVVLYALPVDGKLREILKRYLSV